VVLNVGSRAGKCDICVTTCVVAAYTVVSMNSVVVIGVERWRCVLSVSSSPSLLGHYKLVTA
jgi:hypothetical protein